jgi:hypothetical protein
LSYDPNPWYPVVGREPVSGYEVPVTELAARNTTCVVAVDGPAALAWERISAGLVVSLARAGLSSRAIDVRASFAPWEEILRRTSESELPGDPVFARVFEGALADFFVELPRVPRDDADVVVVFGPGSALVEHDILWYADLPKRQSLAAVQRGRASNVGQPPGRPGSERRLLFVDWPVLDRHKQALAGRIDRYFDLSDPDVPRSLDGESLRRSLRAVAQGPFRVRPTYLAGPWGGQWL